MDLNDDPTGEQEFLHDLSNIISIAQGSLDLLMRKIERNPGEVKIEDMMPKLESSVNAVKRMVKLLNARRDKVRAAMPPAGEAKAAS